MEKRSVRCGLNLYTCPTHRLGGGIVLAEAHRAISGNNVSLSPRRL